MTHHTGWIVTNFSINMKEKCFEYSSKIESLISREREKTTTRLTLLLYEIRTVRNLFTAFLVLVLLQYLGAEFIGLESGVYLRCCLRKPGGILMGFQNQTDTEKLYTL